MMMTTLMEKRQTVGERSRETLHKLGHWENTLVTRLVMTTIQERELATKMKTIHQTMRTPSEMEYLTQTA